MTPAFSASLASVDGVITLASEAVIPATDEGLLVTPHGRVLEAPTSSIFWVENETVLTPPLDEHILASITRGIVIEQSGAEERSCTLQELLEADEAFLVSTTREVQAVSAID